ncbi:MAG TPA: hypothetical protein VMK65_04635, partial [Longimicrobiales bacterium]|nr:hypothetical protein [Longimicrobiales bacterium]
GRASAEQAGAMRGEQAAVQQGLDALRRNVAEAARRSAMMSQDVGAAMGRASLSIQRSLEALSGKDAPARMPVQETQDAVDALNRLALSLLQSGQQMAQSTSATGLQEALDQLARAADQQGQLNGQTSGLLPMQLTEEALARQLSELARQQRHIANQLEGVRQLGGAEDQVLGRLDELAGEAERLAGALEQGRLSPETVARQERLFHRLLDAGRSLEKDELSDERSGERPGDVDASDAPALDPRLLEGGARYRAPDPEELRGLSPTYRRLILEYFERLNRAQGATPPEQP